MKVFVDQQALHTQQNSSLVMALNAMAVAISSNPGPGPAAALVGALPVGAPPHDSNPVNLAAGPVAPNLRGAPGGPVAGIPRTPVERGKLTDTHLKGLAKAKRTFGTDGGKYVRAQEKAGEIKGDLELLEDRRYPSGVKPFEVLATMTEFDSACLDAIGMDFEVKFTIKKDTSRKLALNEMHRQFMLNTRKIEHEAALETQLARQ